MRRNVSPDGGTITISFVMLLAAIPSFAQTENNNIDSCLTPLGMESGHIADRDLYASSTYNYQFTGPQFARLNRQSGAWCPVFNSSGATYLQIDLHEVYIITAIAIQGRFENGNGAEFATEFSVEYYRPELGSWVSYRKCARLPGNTDTSSVTTIDLDPVIFASAVRIFPYSNSTTICIRTELYGCLLDNDLISYSFTDGDLVNDTHYDGVFEEHHQTRKGGLGLLVDKQKLKSFIGLTSDDISGENNFDVTFEFGTFRSFDFVKIYFSEQFNIFFEIGILVSLDGKRFLEVSRSKKFTGKDGYVLIDMDDAIGKFAKVQVHLVSVPLIPISEINFKTTALNISSKHIENIQKFVVNENVDCNNAWFLCLIVANAVLIVALIGTIIFWFYRKRHYISIERREYIH